MGFAHPPAGMPLSVPREFRLMWQASLRAILPADLRGSEGSEPRLVYSTLFSKNGFKRN